MTKQVELFRIGPGYVAYWVHEVISHWNIDKRIERETYELSESLIRLIQRRNDVEKSRRQFLPASSFDKPGANPSGDVQQALYEATQQFFLTYYATLSAFASFLSRFSEEVGNVPHASNKKFLTWLRDWAFNADLTIPILEEARQFRTLLDHRAQHQPFTWATAGYEGLARIFLHGPANRSGTIPDGAAPRTSEDPLPEGDDWLFLAPDEDRVLSALAMQMNAIFPVIGHTRQDEVKIKRCKWEQQLGPEDPEGGYPLFAARSGVVVQASDGLLGIRVDPQPKNPKDRRTIAETLAPYFDEDGYWKGDS